jgi:peptidoglycan/xylan/chitin deacetylase (PgdA/CDA1 family)
MKFVSPFLKRFLYPGLANAGYLHPRVDSAPVIVTYHGILPPDYRRIDPTLDGTLVSADAFRAQLRLLKDRYNIISPEEFLQWCISDHKLPSRSVLLTCDDGLRNILHQMIPILQEVKVHCLFFVTTASLQDTFSRLWHEELYLMFLLAPERVTLRLPELDIDASAVGLEEKRLLREVLMRILSQYKPATRQALLDQIALQLEISGKIAEAIRIRPAWQSRFEMLNIAELRQVLSAGMCIGSHTLSHPVLSRLANQSAWAEISGSRWEMEHSLGRKIWAFAYPFGDSTSVTSRDIDMAERAGYACAFLNTGGSFLKEKTLFAIPRVHVNADTTLAEFEAHLCGLHERIKKYWRGPSHTDAVCRTALEA